MTLKLRHRRVAPETTLKNGDSTTIEIPQDNPLRRVTLNFTQVATNGTGTITNVPFGFLNVIKRIRVVMDGFDNKFDVDARTYFEASTFQNGTVPFLDLEQVFTTTASATTTSTLTLTIDFAQLKNNLNDFSGLLNAPALSSLNLIIDYGNVSDVTGSAGGTPTLASSVDISIDEVYDNGVGENQLPDVVLNSQDFREGLDVTVTTDAHESFNSDELPVKILPVPSTILEHLIYVQTDVTASGFPPSDSLLTQLKLENVRGGGELLFIDKFLNVLKQGKAEFSLEFGVGSDLGSVASSSLQGGRTLRLGAIFISWSELRLEGLLNNVVDALKYKFLTTSTDGTIKIYKKFLVASASVS